MKKLISCFILTLLLPGCSFFKENPEAGQILLRAAAVQYIYESDTIATAQACDRALKLNDAATDARAILDEDVLALPGLEERIRSTLVNNGLNPINTDTLIDIGKIYVRNKQQSLLNDALSEETEITIRELITVVDQVAVQVLQECTS